MVRSGETSSRLTITLSREHHAELKQLAMKLDRSESWIGKHAIEQFLEAQRNKFDHSAGKT